MTPIGVVVPTCDRPELLSRALESVTRQSRAPTEVIVVDNGLTAVPASVKARFPIATFIRLAPRCGVSVARNQGALTATTPWIAFLDDDDRWPEDYLATMVAAAEAGTLDMVAALIRVGDGGEVRRPVPPEQPGVVPAWRQNGYGGSNLLVRRAAFWTVGGFAARLTTGEDRALFIEFVLHELRVGVCEATCCYASVHSGERLTDNAALLRGKLDFLFTYGDRMARRAAREDRFACLVYLSRAWGFPFWLAGLVAYPEVAWRRLIRWLRGGRS
jgi:glycosyltransferase involved in cell wall biosynthesis